MTSLPVLAQTFAQRLPVCLLGGSAIVLFAALLLRFVGRRHAGTRFVVWFSALLGIALLMVFDGFGAVAGQGTVSATTPVPALIEVPASWAMYAFLAWMLLACVALLRVAAGVWQLHRIRKTCSDLDLSNLDGETRELLCNVTSVRHLSICVSERVGTPAAVGFFRPAVILPSWLVKDLSPAELNQVLLHEVAHLSRWDDWTNLAQKVLRALLFFHPLVWWVDTRLSMEREMACDDAVLRETDNPRAYARCLASLAEKSYARRGMALAQAAVSRFRQTSMRVARIVHHGTPDSTRVWKPALSVAALVAFAGVISQCYTPRLFVFEDNAQPTVATRIAGTAQHAQITTAAVQAAAITPTMRHTARVSRTTLKPARPQHRPVEMAKSFAPISRGSKEMAATRGDYVVPETPALGQAVPAKANAADYPHAMYVVMETEQTAHGVTAWQLTVWRVVVAPQKAITPKTI